MTEDAAKIYDPAGILTKMVSGVFYTVERRRKTITEIATDIGHSQPSVTKIIKEMIKADWFRKKCNPMTNAAMWLV
ncbi:hypothetical protein [Flavobacterium noncentrifugens]|uniref:hypothetical protein n=1 Tax=Flavobacterium noncentrifugens TaxID=1128970 RepID=UPI000B147BA4|nr:hypothetical protein [Flavobacterium noncentrifugens]